MITTEPADVLSPAEFVLVALATLAAAAALVALFVRPVPPGQGLVITRTGRRTRTRTRAQGVALVLPLVERVVRIDTRPMSVQPLVARSSTADDLPVVVTARAVVSVADLARVGDVAPDVFEHVADLVEDALVEEVALVDLAALTAHDAAPLRQRVLERVARPLADAGLRADALAVESVEVTAGRDLLTWAETRGRERDASRR